MFTDLSMKIMSERHRTGRAFNFISGLNSEGQLSLFKLLGEFVSVIPGCFDEAFDCKGFVGVED